MKKHNIDTLRKGSMLILSETTTFPDFDNKTQTVNAGKYYVSGFWGNICGINSDKQAANKQESEHFIVYGLLNKFENFD